MSRSSETCGRVLIAAACVLALAGVLLGGCDARNIRACAYSCGARGMARYTSVAVPGVASVEPLCVCRGDADGGRS